MSGRSVEDSIQTEIVRVARERGLFVYHVPNGGQRSPREGAAFKRIGVVSGIPDLVFVLKNGKTAYVEVKTQKGQLSANQKAVIEQFEELGQTVFVAMGLAQGLALVDTICEHEGIEL